MKVTGITPGISSDEVRRVFEDFGLTTITDVYLPSGKGFGFVRFSSEDDAVAAASMESISVNDTELTLELALGKRRDSASKGKGDGKVSIPFPASRSSGGGGLHGPSFDVRQLSSGQKPSSRGEHSIWVGNLPSACTKDELEQIFRSSGVDTMTDVYIPPGKGFGFVRFMSMGEVDQALEQCEGLRCGDNELELKASSTEKRSSPSVSMMAGPGFGPSGCGGGYGYGCGGVYDGYHERYSGGFVDPYGGLDGYGRGGGFVDPYGHPGYGGASSKGSNGKKGSGEHSIWVGNLPDSCTVDELRESFESRGVNNMTDVYIPKSAKDFGFVRFASHDDVERALDRCQELEIGGVEVELKSSVTQKRGAGGPASGPPPGTGFGNSYGSMDVGFSGYGKGSTIAGGGKGKDKSQEVSVKVSGLTIGTSSEEVRRAFYEHGVDTMSDVYVPANRSYGFVRFQEFSDAERALRCDGMQIGSSTIELELAEGGKKSSQDMSAMQRGAVAYHVSQAAYETASHSSRSGEVSLKVSNLDPDVSPQELCEAFAAQGVDSMTDCYIPQGRQFGFLRFATVAEGRQAQSVSVTLRDRTLELEFAVGQKRNAQEMAGAVGPVGPVMSAPRQAYGRDVPRDVPDNPDVSADAPSIKVGNLPPGTSSDELHKAVLSAGCRGGITDVYIPKGDRGFGFVRFSNMRQAEDVARLQVYCRGSVLTMEISVGQRKPRREMAGQEYGMSPYESEAAHGHPPHGGYGYRQDMVHGGYGPANGGFGKGKRSDRGWGTDRGYGPYGDDFLR